MPFDCNFKYIFSKRTIACVKEITTRSRYTGDVWTGNTVPAVRGRSRCYENSTHMLKGPLQHDPSFRFSSIKHNEGDGSGRFLCVPASDAAVHSWAGPITAAGVKILPVIEAIEFSDWSVFEGQHGLEFFDTCAAVAHQYGFSGWSLDWEPKPANSPSSGSADAVAELESFARFLSAFAARLKLHGLELSTAEPNRDLVNTTVQNEPYPVNVTGYRSVTNSGAKILTMSTYYGVMPRDAPDKHFFTKELMAWQSITRPDMLSIGFGVIYRSWASGACEHGGHGGHGTSTCLSLAIDACIAQGIKSITLFQLDAFGWPQVINGRHYSTIPAPWPPADWWPELLRLQNNTRPSKTDDAAAVRVVPPLSPLPQHITVSRSAAVVTITSSWRVGGTAQNSVVWRAASMLANATGGNARCCQLCSATSRTGHHVWYPQRRCYPRTSSDGRKCLLAATAILRGVTARRTGATLMPDLPW